jgi:hypothetical protein
VMTNSGASSGENDFVAQPATTATSKTKSQRNIPRTI